MTPQTALARAPHAPIQSDLSYEETYRNALEPQGFMDAFKAAAMVAQVGICGITSPEDALIRILQGRRFGLGIVDSCRLVYVVDGRPAFDATFMQGLAQKNPSVEKFECTEDTDDKVTYEIKRREWSKSQLVTWTMADAQRAGLLSRGRDPSKNNWNKYPRQMLHARCKAEGARRVDPETLSGLYTREEVTDGAHLDTDQAAEPRTLKAAPPPPAAEPEPVQVAPAPPPAPAPAEKPARAAKAAPAPAPAPVAPPPAPPPPAPAPAPPPPPAVAQAAEEESVPVLEPPPRQAAVRDWEAETAAFEERLSACQSQEELKVLRREIGSWDAPVHCSTKIRALYNEVRNHPRVAR